MAPEERTAAVNLSDRASGRWRVWRFALPVFSLAIFIAALFTIHHLLKEVTYSDIVAAFRSVSWPQILSATIFTAASYTALTGYDVLALRQIGKPLPYKSAAFASFVSYTFSHNIGLSLLTGGSLRYRIYSSAGLSAVESATLTAICALTFGLGIALLFGLAFVVEPGRLSPGDYLPASVNRGIGFAVLAAVGAYVVWSARRDRTVHIAGWRFPVPGLPMTLKQLALGSFDISCAAAALYVLLPANADITFLSFLGIYVAAMTIGVLSHSPGGVGVFEAFMLLALPQLESGQLLGTLLAYRCIYYLLPFLLSATIFAAREIRQRRDAFDRMAIVATTAAPAVLGTLVLIGGAILLFSIATPDVGGRVEVLKDFVPLPFVETSHLLASIVGLVLLLLARGLFRRLDGAFYATAALLLAGAIFSLLKGLDYEEALILLVVLVVLVLNRRAFYRHTSIWQQQFSPGWTVTILAILAASAWLGIFSYKHVEYHDALWWQFAYSGDAPRFLRATLAVAVVGLAFSVLQLLSPARIGSDANLAIPDEIPAIVATALRADANLALTGDKRFLLSGDRRSFIMYGVEGRSWVAMGDPVGPRAEWEPLVWRFREIVDQASGWPVFYEIGADSLPLYIDLGLSLIQLGEEASIDLGRFSLEGRARKDFRHALSRGERDGLTFEIVPAAAVPSLLPELKAVSDAWLSDKAGQEKSFSVGAFHPEYLRRFDAAIVRQAGRIVAFANLWNGASVELSIDLMRHYPDAHRLTMDFLFAHLLFWGKANDFEKFSLGMAPLSGLETHHLAPVWHKAGGFLYRHGEHFYGFEGLRAFKEKFDPVWTPKYLAYPGGLILPRVLFDVTRLISSPDN
jgi:phosphatidylglycerol lysyltransferase